MNNVRTSESHPIHVHWVDATSHGQPGKLGLTFASRKRGPGIVTNASWERSLDANLDRLRDHFQTSVLVSLMEDFEYQMLEIPSLFTEAEARGITVLRLPIVDTSTPKPEELEEVIALVQGIRRALSEGLNVVIHCRGGNGRTGTIAALVLTTYGHSPIRAIELTREAQPRAVENWRQHQYVESASGPLVEAVNSASGN